VPTVDCIALLPRQETNAEFSECYDDVNICLWTDGSTLTRNDAQNACQQRGYSFLPRVNNNIVQSKLTQFRSSANSASNNVLLGGNGFWIDVSTSGTGSFQWLDGTPLAGS